VSSWRDLLLEGNEGSAQTRGSYCLMMWYYSAFISKTCLFSFSTSCLLIYFYGFFMSQLQLWFLKGQVWFLIITFYVHYTSWLRICSLSCPPHMNLFGHLPSTYLYKLTYPHSTLLWIAAVVLEAK
jgi:hypothetical protein